ncbi:FIG01056706: hypothetical protein [Pseudoalteromonas luteoviolacea B = ATCC 29581]|nr:FIG01056706: hypothetical protein [Pseudoalteromonas luteoviolacea B = ATCC 29581]
MHKELAPIFPEYRVIKATELGITIMPILAIITLFTQTSTLGVEYLPQSIAMALLILSLPVQGLLWLGKRAQTPLSPPLSTWYHELYQKMVEHGYDVRLAGGKPRYQELATLLNDMFEKMDKAFTKEQL